MNWIPAFAGMTFLNESAHSQGLVSNVQLSLNILVKTPDFYLSIVLPTIVSPAAPTLPETKETRRWTSRTATPHSISRKPT
jgi:hypothetical protein